MDGQGKYYSIKHITIPHSSQCFAGKVVNQALCNEQFESSTRDSGWAPQKVGNFHPVFWSVNNIPLPTYPWVWRRVQNPYRFMRKYMYVYIHTHMHSWVVSIYMYLELLPFNWWTWASIFLKSIHFCSLYKDIIKRVNKLANFFKKKPFFFVCYFVWENQPTSWTAERFHFVSIILTFKFYFSKK